MGFLRQNLKCGTFNEVAGQSINETQQDRVNIR